MALLLAQMLNPRAHQEGLDKQTGALDIFIHRPAHRPGAAAHPAQLVDRLQEGFGVLRVDEVLVRDQHRAAFVRQVNLYAVQRLTAQVEVQVRIFLQLPAEHRRARQHHPQRGDNQRGWGTEPGGDLPPEGAACGHRAEEHRQIHRQRAGLHPAGGAALRAEIEGGEHRNPREASEKLKQVKQPDVAHKRQRQHGEGKGQAGGHHQAVGIQPLAQARQQNRTGNRPQANARQHYAVARRA